MDFASVELSADDREFRDRLRAFLAELVTDDVRRRDRETGENFDEGVHLALGAEGYLAADWNDEPNGGFSALHRRIWDLEIGRAHTPWFHWGTTAMVAHTVQQFGSAELTDEVLPGVLSGHIRLCLGYTEPEGGSDVATCKTRAVSGTARAGLSTAPRCSRPMPTMPNTFSCSPIPTRMRQNTRT